MNEEEKNEQTAVAETDDDPKKESSDDSGAAQTAEADPLDELLKEFDERQEASSKSKESGQSQTESKDEQPSTIDLNALAQLEKRLNEQEVREQRRELDNLFNRFADGVEADAVDAEAFLGAMANRDPRINQAYQNRGFNPKAWARIEVDLKQKFEKRYGKKVDKQVTESRDAVASAVRSASTAAPQKEYTDKDIAKMSKADFDEWQRKLGVTPV